MNLEMMDFSRYKESGDWEDDYEEEDLSKEAWLNEMELRAIAKGQKFDKKACIKIREEAKKMMKRITAEVEKYVAENYTKILKEY
jgi:hypothetical protein